MIILKAKLELYLINFIFSSTLKSKNIYWKFFNNTQIIHYNTNLIIFLLILISILTFHYDKFLNKILIILS